MILSVGLFTGAAFMVNEHLSNKDYNPNITTTGKKITVLCLDKNGNPIINTEIRVSGVTNQDIVAIYTTDDIAELYNVIVNSLWLHRQLIQKKITSISKSELKL